MAVGTREASQRIELMTQALRDAGLKLTHQRLEVLREIASTDEHPDVETIYRRVRSRVPTISLDTVYRTLSTLAERRLIEQVRVVAGPARYDANVNHHHHFVCTRCGGVRDVEASAIKTSASSAAAKQLGTVERIEVQMCGICKECAAEERQRKKGR